MSQCFFESPENGTVGVFGYVDERVGGGVVSPTRRRPWGNEGGRNRGRGFVKRFAEQILGELSDGAASFWPGPRYGSFVEAGWSE